ncbi:MAG: hypothetical protein IKM83_06835 [Paludibacteraceae bacterium]|nr:hypothetical protein [Paludibacteraceae bacterium]
MNYNVIIPEKQPEGRKLLLVKFSSTSLSFAKEAQRIFCDMFFQTADFQITDEGLIVEVMYRHLSEEIAKAEAEKIVSGFLNQLDSMQEIKDDLISWSKGHPARKCFALCKGEVPNQSRLYLIKNGVIHQDIFSSDEEYKKIEELIDGVIDKIL